jgi:hypothetical protein
MIDLWGYPTTRTAEYFVFHDESEPKPNKGWLLIGLLFVDARRLSEARAALAEARTRQGYEEEIHFARLPKSFDGSWGVKARVARDWLRSFQDSLHDFVFFSALAVDRQSPRYEHKRFATHFHEYNRFTAMALKAGITWFLGPQGLDALRIHFISDAKDRASRPDRHLSDNFETYLPYRAELDAFLSQSGGRPYPMVNVDLKLQDSRSDDLLQLCDVMLGATQMALVAGSARPTKRELGEMVARWCRDLQQPPCKRQFHLYRKFSLWAFPDRDGRPYSPVRLALNGDGASWSSSRAARGGGPA